MKQGFYSGNNYRIDDSVFHLMRRAFTALTASMEATLDQKDELTLVQVRALRCLLCHETLRIVELARLSEVTDPAMTRLLDRLERKRLCQRVRAASDRRVVNVVLTALGRAIAEKYTPTVIQLQNQILAGFSSSEFDHLQELLERMAKNSSRGLSSQNRIWKLGPQSPR
jgi:DNA-binding MarR family transcriptional regulator